MLNCKVGCIGWFSFGIKNEYKKLIPTVEIIDKIKEMENLNELAKNKIKSGQNNITDIEKEICRKAG